MIAVSNKLLQFADSPCYRQKAPHRRNILTVPGGCAHGVRTPGRALCNAALRLLISQVRQEPCVKLRASRRRGMCVLFNGASLLVDHSVDAAGGGIPLAPPQQHDLLHGVPAADRTSGEVCRTGSRRDRICSRHRTCTCTLSAQRAASQHTARSVVNQQNVV